VLTVGVDLFAIGVILDVLLSAVGTTVLNVLQAPRAVLSLEQAAVSWVKNSRAKLQFANRNCTANFKQNSRRQQKLFDEGDWVCKILSLLP